MELIQDKETLFDFFQRNIYLHIYSIGDLDDYFWPHTQWFGLREDGELTAVILLYTGGSTPTLLALSDSPAAMRQLVAKAISHLPDQFYAHFSPGIATAFEAAYQIQSFGDYLKMGLRYPHQLASYDTQQTILLTPADVTAVSQFYDLSYPGNWFEPHMLEVGHYYGLMDNGVLAAIAGIHVYSAEYKVAALGGITTHPDHRGKGYAQLVTARLCRELLKTVDHIGLNVKATNETAVAVYRKLGFEPVAPYGEYQLCRRDATSL